MSVSFDPNNPEFQDYSRAASSSLGTAAPPPSPVHSHIQTQEERSLPLVISDRIRQNITLQESKKVFGDQPDPSRYWSAIFTRAEGCPTEAAAIVNETQSEASSSHAREFDIFERAFIGLASVSPQLLSGLGLLESINVLHHNTQLDDVSPEALRNRIREAKTLLKELESVPPESIPESLRTSYETLCWMFDQQIKGAPYLLHSYHINQMFGVIFELNQTFIEHHKLDTPVNVENYLIRMRRIPIQLMQAIAFLDEQEKAGIIPPRLCVEKVIEIIRSMIPKDVENHLYFIHLKSHTESPMILGEAKAILTNEVYPAFLKLLDVYQNLLEKAQDNHGVDKLPQGSDYYLHLLKEHTTTDLPPDMIHEMGIKEVERIHAEMRVHLARVGIEDPEVCPGILMQKLQERDELYFSNDEKGRQECMAEIEKILERCRRELWPLFGITPKSPVKVKPVPRHEEDAMPGAYYCEASLDGSRPGYYFINLRSMKELPRFGLETLSVHEAEPGHHFQDTIRNELPFPLVMKIIGFTASQEGWALYVEKLAFEQGFFSSDYDILGHLQDEILRAARLVVDTGLHAMGWTREQAIDYMVEATGYTRETVETEVDRYLVMPGQACAYKVGQLKILELRQNAKEALNERFDLREFHNAVLQAGIVPLPVLEKAVERYIEATLAADSPTTPMSP